MFDPYRPLLKNALFPAFEALRGRPTVSLLESLVDSERWSAARLRARQAEKLRRLVDHAYRFTTHYRLLLDERGLHPDAFGELDALATLPLLDRTTVRATLETRTATTPAVAVQKTTSGSTGQPVTVRYCAESRHWRDAVRWRGYGWAGYEIGMRAFHYWGIAPPPASWLAQRKVDLDRFLKRDLYVDCTPRGDDALRAAATQLRDFEPHVIVAYASGAAALARFVVENRLRTWQNIPVLVGAERLWPYDRAAIEEAFGPVFETYGCREVMLIASECEHHDGLHTSMESLIVEVLVREPDGTTRAARPGERGELAVTDLHNLACPMLRYLTGDLAVAREPTVCPCGRGLEKIGPIDGRVAHTLRDGKGRAVSGLVFNILFGIIGELARNFRVTQRRDGSVVLAIVPAASALDSRDDDTIRAFAAKYLPGVPFTIDLVDALPLTAAGKREVVVVEPPA